MSSCSRSTRLPSTLLSQSRGPVPHFPSLRFLSSPPFLPTPPPPPLPPSPSVSPFLPPSLSSSYLASPYTHLTRLPLSVSLPSLYLGPIARSPPPFPPPPPPPFLFCLFCSFRLQMYNRLCPLFTQAVLIRSRKVVVSHFMTGFF